MAINNAETRKLMQSLGVDHRAVADLMGVTERDLSAMLSREMTAEDNQRLHGAILRAAKAKGPKIERAVLNY